VRTDLPTEENQLNKCTLTKLDEQILILILSSTISVTMNAQTLQGNHWTAKRVEGAYIVSIEDRASILDALTGFITSQKFKPDK